MTRQGDEPILTTNEDRLYSIFEFSLKLFIFLSPIFYFGDLKASFAQSLFFIFASVFLFSLSLTLKPKRHFSNLWASLFLIWSILSVFLHGIEITSTAKLTWPIFAISADGMLYILAGFLLFKTVFEHIKDPAALLKPILLVAVLNLIFVSLQTAGINLFYTYRLTNCGLMGISSQLGSYSAMSLPVIFFINPYLAIIPASSIIMAKSFSPLFAVFIGLVIYLNIIKLQYSNIMILLISILFYIYIGYHWDTVWARFSARFITWQQLTKAVVQRPYIGWGWRSYLNVVPELGRPVLERPHSDFLHLAQEIGITGVIFVGLYFKDLWQRFRIADKDRLTWLLAASIFIILINASFQTTFRYANISGTFVVLLAFLEVKLHNAKTT